MTVNVIAVTMTETVTLSSVPPEIPVARRLREARVEAGLTLKELAEALGVDTRTVARWQAEKNAQRPKYERLVQIARILNKPVSYFLEP